MNNFLSDEEVITLKAAHRKEKNRRVADRIKAVLLANKGWSYRQISEALLLDEDTISKHVSEYKKDKKLEIVTGGSESKLSSDQTTELLEHLESYWLKNNGFSFIKPHGVPSKADPNKQEAFIKEYEKLKKETPGNEPILFCDAVHPTMSTKITYGWIRKGTRKVIKTTGSKTRMNILGAINLSSMEIVEKSDYKTIDSGAMEKFFDVLKEKYKDSPKIHLIVDNSGYNTSEKTRSYAKERGIVLHYLPSYSPNLNAIERLWKIMNEYSRNNRFFNNAKEFRESISNFFHITWHNIKHKMESRINDKFHTIQAS